MNHFEVDKLNGVGRSEIALRRCAGTQHTVERRGIAITGWEAFNEYPDLILFEGYLTRSNEAHLERKRA